VRGLQLLRRVLLLLLKEADMSEHRSLALDLEGLEIEPFEAIDPRSPYLESLTGGTGMTEMGASYETNTGSASCSCCVSCCCCC
jgi:thiazolylpeptide-type bacteriocin precursor